MTCRALPPLLLCLLALHGCAGPRRAPAGSPAPRSAPACGAAPAALGEAEELLPPTAAERHLRWDLPESAALLAPALPPIQALHDLRAGVRARVDVSAAALLARQVAVFAAAGDPALRPEADNGRLILAGRAGRIEPLRCLEALLLAVQAERYPMLTQPSEFGAFILRRPAGAAGAGARLRVYFSGSDRSGLKLRAAVLERVAADLGRGYVLLSHLHNHPFLFDRRVGDRSWTTADTVADIAGALAPSLTDVQFYRSLQESLGLQGAWITNGFDTLHLPAAAFPLLRAHPPQRQ